MRQAQPEVTALVAAVVEPLGYELVGVEYVTGDHGSVLRVYIDQEQGITVDDCALVSHQVSGQLDLDDPIAGQYELEVSSPGLDRPLFNEDHLSRYRGERARVRLREKRAGRRNFEGLLGDVVSGELHLRLDGGETEPLPLDLIETARLVPDFSFSKV